MLTCNKEKMDSNFSLVLILSITIRTSLRRTSSGPTKLSIIERVSSGQGLIIHYVGYIWDSVSVYLEG